MWTSVECVYGSYTRQKDWRQGWFWWNNLGEFKEQEKKKNDWSGVRERERDGRGAHEDDKRPDHIEFRGYSENMSDWSFV